MRISTFFRIHLSALVLLAFPCVWAADVTFYSETLYDSRIEGSTTDNRLRLQSQVFYDIIRIYGGFQYSQDLTNGRAPVLAENAVSPTLGFHLQLRPSVVLFTEFRKLFRFQNSAAKSSSENEMRAGFFGYFYHQFVSAPVFFNEVYFEGVSISRISSNPVFSVWNKLGTDFKLNSNFNHNLYLEAFSRQSPAQGYGPLENEFRLGSRLKYSKNQWAVGFLIHYAFLSNIKTNATDALLYIAKEAF